MGDYVNLRSRVKQATVVQEKERQEVVPLLERNKKIIYTCKCPKEKQPKNLVMQKKAQRVLPGSMSLYSKMRQKQQHAKSTTGGMEMHHNEEYYDEQEDEQGSDDHVNNIRASPLRAFSSNTNKVAEDFPMLANENEFQKETQQLVTTTTKKASTIKKTRGPTVMVEVHNRKFEGRPVIVLNEYGQPIGTTKEVCGELSRFLGTIARDSKLAPLNYCDWTSLPSKFKEKMWDYILEKYMIPGDGQ
ncbi:uncharacterized protein LOC110715071 [Chenopodium quinoa]|uniref:uncharacterized protein LOC110715071 n=1 Tax=Chenopodium quinoa TaxID=63459 RepID=UPI000B7760DA|nr:uncharacterized protein LOC110715071 [Chenopodium quinoa]